MILSIGTKALRLALFALLLCLASSAWSAPQVRFPDGDLSFR